MRALLSLPLPLALLLAACGAPSADATDSAHGAAAADSASPAEGPLTPRFSFVVIADPHVSGPGEHADRLMAAVAWVNDHAIDRDLQLVVVLGDIAWDDGIGLADEILGELTVSWVPVLGDNEIQSGDAEAFFVAFADQLAQTVTGLDDSVVVLSHMPLFDGPGGLTVDEAAQVVETLDPHRDTVWANLAGHLHGNSSMVWDEAGLEVHVTDATWDDDNALRVVTVTGNDHRFAYAHDLVVIQPGASRAARAWWDALASTPAQASSDTGETPMHRSK